MRKILILALLLTCTSCGLKQTGTMQWKIDPNYRNPVEEYLGKSGSTGLGLFLGAAAAALSTDPVGLGIAIGGIGAELFNASVDPALKGDGKSTSPAEIQSPGN